MTQPPQPSNQPQKPKSFQLTMGKPGCLGIGLLVILGFIGLIVILSANAPYKVSCSGGSNIYNGGFSDRASADAAYAEKQAQGMSCSKEYK